jgi:hypothetical protein
VRVKKRTKHGELRRDRDRLGSLDELNGLLEKASAHAEFASVRAIMPCGTLPRYKWAQPHRRHVNAPIFRHVACWADDKRIPNLPW